MGRYWEQQRYWRARRARSCSRGQAATRVSINGYDVYDVYEGMHGTVGLQQRCGRRHQYMAITLVRMLRVHARVPCLIMSSDREV